jgi:hypothetical protein
VDEYKRTDIIGYGSCYVPSSPGEHKVTVACFRPKGTTLEEIQAYFLGGTPTYDDVRLVGQGDSRFMHPTVSTGSVVVELSVVMKQFHKHVSLAAEDLDKYVNESVCDTCRPTKNGATLAAMQDEVDREDFVNTMMHGEGNDTLLDDTRMSISKSYLR